MNYSPNQQLSLQHVETVIQNYALLKDNAEIQRDIQKALKINNEILAGYDPLGETLNHLETAFVLLQAWNINPEQYFKEKFGA